MTVHLPADDELAAAGRRDGGAQVHAGLPPSLRGASFGGVLRAALGCWLLVPGEGAEDRRLVQQTATRFVESGGTMIMVGGLHGEGDNSNLITRSTAGALDASPGDTRWTVERAYWQTPKGIASQAWYGKMLADPARRAEFIKDFYKIDGPTDAYVNTTFPTLARNPHLTLDYVNWFDTQRQYIPRLLASDQVEVLTVGIHHIWAKLAGPGRNMWSVEWTPQSLIGLFEGDKPISDLSPAEVDKVFMLRDQSVKAGRKTMFLFSDRVFTKLWTAPKEQLKFACINNYKALGAFVIEMPLRKGANALAVVDLSMLPGMQQLANDNPLIRVHCAGLPGCEPDKPAAPKTDL